MGARHYSAKKTVPLDTLYIPTVFLHLNETLSSFVYSSSGHKICFVVLVESSITLMDPILHLICSINQPSSANFMCPGTRLWRQGFFLKLKVSISTKYVSIHNKARRIYNTGQKVWFLATRKLGSMVLSSIVYPSFN